MVGVDVGEDEPADLVERVAGGLDRDLERVGAGRVPGGAAVDQGQLVGLDHVRVDVADLLPGERDPQPPQARPDLARARGRGIDLPVSRAAGRPSTDGVASGNQRSSAPAMSAGGLSSSSTTLPSGSCDVDHARAAEAVDLRPDPLAAGGLDPRERRVGVLDVQREVGEAGVARPPRPVRHCVPGEFEQLEHRVAQAEHRQPQLDALVAHGLHRSRALERERHDHPVRIERGDVERARAVDVRDLQADVVDRRAHRGQSTECLVELQLCPRPSGRGRRRRARRGTGPRRRARRRPRRPRPRDPRRTRCRAAVG